MKKALEINPYHALANFEYGLSITSFGKFEKANEYDLTYNDNEFGEHGGICTQVQIE